MRTRILAVVLFVALIAVTQKSSGVLVSGATLVTRAVAVLSPTEANSVSGTVTFTKAQNGIRIVADVSGLTPGAHGFHIHEFGDCTARDASSAGGHFNPARTQHGPPDTQFSHAGDLGNLVADAAGKAHYERTDSMIVLEGPNSIIGRAVIVHENADDFRTQPTGNSGRRVACGVIGLAQ
jgi:Cu-Zn family superoxide dismutase